MGQVFRARHAMLRRPTAIKLMHPDRAGKQALARFEREVQMTSRLTHPNTIAIFDYGRTPDGVFYYAMEYLPGIDLARLVEIDGAQPEGRVIHILRQVCGSLAEAHSHGLIHRDIKPENVILCERGGRHDVAKVLDFGIVKEIGGGSATQLTAVDAFTGTPLYVAPEAWSKPDEIDARADLYALAVVGYLMLTGERLFEADSVMDMYRHHVNTPPVPLSERLGRTIAPDLERVILRCLDKDPANRPQNAQELADELSACAAAADWTEDAARAWWADHESDVGPSGDTDATEVVSTPTSTVVVNVD
jgi:serine/threonine protein kinase